MRSLDGRRLVEISEEHGDWKEHCGFRKKAELSVPEWRGGRTPLLLSAEIVGVDEEVGR